MYLRWERNATARTWTALYKQRVESPWLPAAPPVPDAALFNASVAVPLVGVTVSSRLDEHLGKHTL